MEEIHENFLPPIYKSAYFSLKNDLSQASSDLEKSKIIQIFAKQYWIMPCFWEIYRQTEGIEPKELGIAIDFSNVPSNSIYLKHVFWNKSETFENLCRDDFINGILETEKALTIPCKGMQEIANIFNNFATCPVPNSLKEKFKKAVILKEELIENWNKTTEEWLKTLFKLETIDLIIANFEYRLSRNQFVTDKELWKEYIKFLKNHDQEKMFMAFKHYTRFFIEDSEMVDEYRNEILQAMGVSKTNFDRFQRFMFDTLEWECYFGNFEIARAWMERYKSNKDTINFLNFTKEELLKILSNVKAQINENLNNIDSSCDVEMINAEREPTQLCHANFNVFYRQLFDFPPPMLRHTFQNVQSTVLQKLYQSCKYFFATFKTPLCYRLVVGGSKSQYYEQSLQISDSDYLKPKFQDLISRMKIANYLQWQIKSDKKSFSNYLKEQKFDHFHYVSLHHQILSEFDFCHLLEFGPGSIYLDSLIQKSDGTFMMTVEEICKSFPFIR